MTMKEIRKMTGLTQAEFAKKYEFSLQTLKQWESSKTSKSYRECPAYVLNLTKSLVVIEIERDMARMMEKYKKKAVNKNLLDSAGKVW